MPARGRILANVACASALAASLLLTLGASAPGVTGSVPKAAPRPTAGAPVSGPTGCEAGPLAPDFLLSVDPAVALSTPDGIDRGGRTCRCSCGYPCKTDADCGGAIGSCRGGISCC